MSEAALADGAADAAVSPTTMRQAKRQADFARLGAGPAKVTARVKESIIGKELDRLKGGAPAIPVISPNRRIVRSVAAFKNGRQIVGAAVEGWNNVTGRWVPGSVVSTSTRRPRGEGDAATTAYVLVDILHPDSATGISSRRAYMVECVRRVPE